MYIVAYHWKIKPIDISFSLNIDFFVFCRFRLLQGGEFVKLLCLILYKKSKSPKMFELLITSVSHSKKNNDKTEWSKAQPRDSLFIYRPYFCGFSDTWGHLLSCGLVYFWSHLFSGLLHFGGYLHVFGHPHFEFVLLFEVTFIFEVLIIFKVP